MIGSLAVIFILTAVIGYVYSHEPVRDTLTVELSTAEATGNPYLSGTIVTVDATSLTIVDATGAERTVPFSVDVPIEQLLRSGAAPAPGTMVNIGVNDTRFGQFVTGIVAIEAAP